MFDWDENKQKLVLKDHKVDFKKIQDIFDDPDPLEYIDEKHSDANETRFVIIVMTSEYGLVFLSYTPIDDYTIRFITAWKADKWMERDYEQNK